MNNTLILNRQLSKLLNHKKILINFRFLKTLNWPFFVATWDKSSQNSANSTIAG